MCLSEIHLFFYLTSHPFSEFEDMQVLNSQYFFSRCFCVCCKLFPHLFPTFFYFFFFFFFLVFGSFLKSCCGSLRAFTPHLLIQISRVKLVIYREKKCMLFHFCISQSSLQEPGKVGQPGKEK